MQSIEIGQLPTLTKVSHNVAEFGSADEAVAILIEHFECFPNLFLGIRVFPVFRSLIFFFFNKKKWNKFQCKRLRKGFYEECDRLRTSFEPSWLRIQESQSCHFRQHRLMGKWHFSIMSRLISLEDHCGKTIRAKVR
jgi:hypothetical protein